MTHKRYSHHDIHRLLSDKWYRGDNYEPPSRGQASWDEIEQRNTMDQALFCPYYVPLEGTLGADWGVIVNPESPKFGELVFEHDECKCPTPHPGDFQSAPDSWMKR